jgi:hypothetical protein
LRAAKRGDMRERPGHLRWLTVSLPTRLRSRSPLLCGAPGSGGGADAIEVPGTGEVVAGPAAGSVAWCQPGTSAFSIGIRVPSGFGAGIGMLTSRIPVR